MEAIFKENYLETSNYGIQIKREVRDKIDNILSGLHVNCTLLIPGPDYPYYRLLFMIQYHEPTTVEELKQKIIAAFGDEILIPFVDFIRMPLIKE